MEKKHIGFQLDEATLREFRHAAVDANCTVSELLRRLVREHLEKKRERPEQVR